MTLFEILMIVLELLRLILEIIPKYRKKKQSPYKFDQQRAIIKPTGVNNRYR